MFEPLAGGRYAALTAKIIKEDIFIFDTKIFEPKPSEAIEAARARFDQL